MFKKKSLILILLLPVFLTGCARAQGALAQTGESDLAHNALDTAFADQSDYPLAILLRRVFYANWPVESFAAMRAQLHPKICAALFGGSI
jgi:hypothetical protein